MADTPQSLQGKLILDSGKLAGSYFDRTVILVCRHDDTGAFGLVLNRSLKHTLGGAVREKLDDQLAKTPLFLGGPVQPEALSFLHESEPSPGAGVLPGLMLGHSLKELCERHAERGRGMRLRAYAGYAGWSPGQLDEEMAKGCWITHPATLVEVFSTRPESLWKMVLRDKGGLHGLVADFPENPGLN